MAGTKSKWQLPQKNVEEKDSKTVALISLLVTVFFFCIVVIVILNTHLTRKNGACLSNIYTYVCKYKSVECTTMN